MTTSFFTLTADDDPSRSLSFRALLFDLDGVLVDSMASIERGLCRWAVEQAIPEEVVLRAAHGRTLVQLVAAVAPQLDAEEHAQLMNEREIADVGGLLPCPGAAELLGGLPDDAWAVVTSGRMSLASTRLRAARLPWPATLVTADDVTRGKPDPEGYVRGATGLGFEPRECVVVEDAAAGVAAGRAAGCRVIGVDAHGSGALAAADLVVASLAELELHAAVPAQLATAAV